MVWPRVPTAVIALPAWSIALVMLLTPAFMVASSFCWATGMPSAGVFNEVIIWFKVSRTFWVW